MKALFASLLFAVLSSMDATAGSVFTSQVGFAPADPKTAVLAMPTGADVQQSFRVLNAATSAVVYTSRTADVRFYPAGWSGNNTTGDTYLLDFTSAKLAHGRYVVESNGARSLPFTVDASVYNVTHFRPLEFFRIEQSGVSVSWQSLDGTTGSHGPDHLDDARQATPEDTGGGDRTLIEQDLLPLPGGHLDVAGGWCDAGDYNTYMGNMPWAAYLLLLTYEDYRPYWSKVDNNHNGQPDILEYTRPALEWMLKMRHADGSVYERVFNGFTAKFDGRPDLETDNKPGNADDRPLDTDRYADITAKSSYAMAAAYRVFHDPRYLDMAVKTWDWAFANQSKVKAKVYGGGLYFGDVEIGLTLGALELHRAQRATGKVPDPKYLDYARTHVRNHLTAGDWVNPSGWAYQQSYTLIRYYDLASSDDKRRIVAQLKAYCDRGIQSQAHNVYRMNDQWLYGGFGQNDSATSSAGDALWVFGKTKDRKYYDYAVNQMAWVFGRNPFGECWLASASVGKYPRLPHWRVTAKHAIEGVVVPGAADRDRNHIPDYTDTGEHFYSEPTINQQAMFIRAMTALHFASGSIKVPPAR
jgi:endoglucanase